MANSQPEIVQLCDNLKEIMLVGTDWNQHLESETNPIYGEFWPVKLTPPL